MTKYGASEKEFLQSVKDLARRNDWLVYHTFDSRRSDAGYPDLTMVHPDDGRVLFAELKVGKNDLTPMQKFWCDALADAGEDVFVWYPEDWPEIERTLIVKGD